MVLLLAALVAAAAAAAVQSGVAAKRAQPDAAAAALVFGASATDAIEASLGDLCWTRFQDLPVGIVDEHCETRAALERGGVRSLKFVGSVAVGQPPGDGGDSGLTPGQHMFCGMQTNVGAVHISRSIAADDRELFAIDERGRYVITLHKRTPAIFFELVGVPERVVATTTNRGGDETTLVYSDDALVGSGLYAFAAAQPGGEFDRISIGATVSVDGDDTNPTFCITRIGVPCYTIPDDAGDSADDCPDVPATLDHAVLAKRSALEHGHHDQNRHPHDDDGGGEDERVARTLTLHSLPSNEIVDAYANLGPLCAVDFDSFDAGFAFEQYPRRLPFNGLDAVAYRGLVNGSASAINFGASSAPFTYEKGFCAIKQDTGAIVVDEASSEFFRLAVGGKYVLRFTKSVSAAIVHILFPLTTNANIRITPLLKHRAGQSHFVRTSSASERNAITIAANDGEFDEIHVQAIDEDDEDREFCLLGVAVPCNDL